jgi:hypothetical protein
MNFLASHIIVKKFSKTYHALYMKSTSSGHVATVQGAHLESHLNRAYGMTICHVVIIIDVLPRFFVRPTNHKRIWIKKL